MDRLAFGGDLPAMTLWAITSYFNPAGAASRLRNYRLFRRCLDLPLISAELFLGERPELGQDDAEILLQIPGNDRHRMWQKERLLNLALDCLPADCTAIAWLDCDIVFADRNWAQICLQLLQQRLCVQLFDRVHYLGQELSGAVRLSEWVEACGSAYSQPSAAGNWLRQVPRRYRQVNGLAESTVGNTGMAWAARRSLLERHRFYDASIKGSGDRLLFHAMIGRLDALSRQLPPGSAQEHHFLGWAKPFHAEVEGSVGALEGDLFHLWHGELRDRRYGERHRRMAGFDFDPFHDIVLDGNGCWCWSSAKPEMHAYLRDYFESRREDGSL